MLEVHEITAAKAAVWQLILVGVAAILAYGSRNRLVALLGGFGAFIGYWIPQQRPDIYASYTRDGAYLAVMNRTVSHLAEWGVLGAVLGIATGLIVGGWRRGDDACDELQAHSQTNDSDS